MSDPMEALIAQALTRSGIGYSRDEGGGNPTGLDFGLENGVQIEVKRFHTPRIAEQMARAPDVIAVQGEGAVRFMAGLLAPEGGPYEARAGSQSAHCCFEATVVDTRKPHMVGKEQYRDHCEAVCECFELKDAQLIARALNALARESGS